MSDKQTPDRKGASPSAPRRVEKVGEAQLIEDSAGRLAISVPIRIKQRGRRKRVTLPGGETAALARGNRWLAMLESGEAGSLREIADREGVDNSYVSRMINLTCLAPDIVAAILDDTLPDHVTLFDLAVDPPRLWEAQRKILQLDG